MVLGIDPGLAATGVALIRSTGNRHEVLLADVIKTPAGEPGPGRLKRLHEQLTSLVTQHPPESAAVEQLFFGAAVTTGMQVAEARGVILLVLEQAGIPIWEYTPLQVKQSLTGYGRATKPQMMKMVRTIVDLPQKLPDDAFDAVAIAVCHSHARRLAPERQIS